MCCRSCGENLSVSINEAKASMNETIKAISTWNNDSHPDIHYDYPTEEEVKELYKKYDNNQAVSDEAYWILIVAYSILIVLGCIGNLGVIIAVAGNKSKWNRQTNVQISKNFSANSDRQVGNFQGYLSPKLILFPSECILQVSQQVLAYIPYVKITFVVSEMRTARNIFIATLAVADSTLCVFTMPMTLLGVLTKYWPFGTETGVLCTIVRTWPAINAFFSSYTMAVIAFDRHRFIVHSSKRQVRTNLIMKTGNF